MPHLVSFRGRPVKRRRRTSSGLCLIFVSPISRLPGDVVVVTQDEWRLHGTVQFYPSGRLPDLRKLAEHYSTL